MSKHIAGKVCSPEINCDAIRCENARYSREEAMLKAATNCSDCDVSFEDYPEMRTKSNKCSTCSR